MLTGCQHGDPGKVKQDELYFDYRIMAAEDKPVSCMFQYKKGGEEGEAVAIEPPGKVELDGELLHADSAGFSGVFYEKYFPSYQFRGSHTISMTNPARKIFRETFQLQDFGIEELPDQVIRQPFLLQFKNFPNTKTRVRLQLIDTAFYNNDVIEVLQVVDGTFMVTEKMLRQLKSGPVSMEISREEERPLQQNSARGKINITYSLKRDFQLVDK